MEQPTTKSKTSGEEMSMSKMICTQSVGLKVSNEMIPLRNVSDKSIWGRAFHSLWFCSSDCYSATEFSRLGCLKELG